MIKNEKTLNLASETAVTQLISVDPTETTGVTHRRWVVDKGNQARLHEKGSGHYHSSAQCVCVFQSPEWLQWANTD